MLHVYGTHMYIIIVSVLLGISIVDADITTDVVEPADFNRYVSAPSDPDP